MVTWIVIGVGVVSWGSVLWLVLKVLKEGQM
jgi:hypothetical protein